MGPNTKEDLHDTPPGNRREGSNNVAWNMNFLKGYSPMTKNKRIEGETNHKVRRKECALSTVCFTSMVGVKSFNSQEGKKIRQVSSNLEIQTENGIVRSTTQARVYIQELVTYCRWEDCAKSRNTPTVETKSTPQLAKKKRETIICERANFVPIVAATKQTPTSPVEGHSHARENSSHAAGDSAVATGLRKTMLDLVFGKGGTRRMVFPQSPMVETVRTDPEAPNTESFTRKRSSPPKERKTLSLTSSHLLKLRQRMVWFRSQKKRKSTSGRCPDTSTSSCG